MAGFKRRSSSQQGAKAERVAERFLRKAGLKLIGRNYYCRFGEIDLIMQDDEHLVFVEVRQRTSGRFGGAAASVSYRKQLRLIRTARFYLAYTGDTDTPCRFDVVAVSTAHSNPEWIRNAFDLTQ